MVSSDSVFHLEHVMTIEAIIFDRDGVLTRFDVDAADQFLQSVVPISSYEIMSRWQAWGEEIGFPRSLDEESRFLSGLWRRVGQELGLTDAQIDELDGLDYTSFMRVYPEVERMLTYLREQGLRIGVLSNFALASLDMSLEAVGLAEYIDVACAATVIGSAKPEATAYRRICEELSVDATSTVLFDDEGPCIAGALAVGIDAFLVQRDLSEHDIAKRSRS